MKKQNRSKHTARTVVLALLLALVCIGGAELLAIRHFEPALYQSLTAPVRRAASAVGDAVGAAGRGAAARVGAFWESLTQRQEDPPAAPSPSEEPASQLAGEPVLMDIQPVTDPSITELAMRGELEILTGGWAETVYFNQADDAWASQPYGWDNIGGYGCGPCVMSMAVSTITGQVVDPAAMARWAADNGHWAKGNGSYYTIVQGAAQAYGLQALPLAQRTPQALQSALLSGNLLVALMGPGHFTGGGHFILLRGVTLTGEILVADSNSRERSLTAWDPQLILDELSSGTQNGAPIWVLSEAPPA